jgi:hypothetical protein
MLSVGHSILLVSLIHYADYTDHSDSGPNRTEHNRGTVRFDLIRFLTVHIRRISYSWKGQQTNREQLTHRISVTLK